MVRFLQSFDLFGVITNGIVAIVVALISYKQKVRDKKDEEYRELQLQLDAEREERLLKEKKENEERLESIEKSVKTLSSDMETLKTCVKDLSIKEVQDIKKQLRNLHIMESENFIYIQSLSNVVVNVGETLNESVLIDDDAKEILENCITEHKKQESDIHTKLYKLIL